MKKPAITPLQLQVLRCYHEDPKIAACDVGARLQVTTWSIHEAVGSMWVDGLLTSEPGQHHLTEAGASAIGVEYVPHSSTAPAPVVPRGQLGLFGGAL